MAQEVGSSGSRREIPTEGDLRRLGSGALAAFAVRCAQRVSPDLIFLPWSRHVRHVPQPDEDELSPVRAALEMAERGSADGHVPMETATALGREALDASGRYRARMIDRGHQHGLGLIHSFDGWFDAHHDVGYTFAQTAEAAVAALNSVLAAQRGAQDTAVDQALKAAASARSIVITPWYERPEAERLIPEIARDYELLRESLNSASDRSPYPDLFALNAEFDTTCKFDGKSIIVIANEIQTSLLSHAVRRPELLYRLSPRDFEAFVGSLFEQFGFQVELTAATRDGGRDVIAICHGTLSAKYLIECKRYAPTKKVGIAAVQRLYGVVQDERATKGILATTAGAFSHDATTFLDRNRWLLEGRAYDGLVSWLRDYERLKMMRAWSQ